MFAIVPSSTSENVVRGDGVAEKPKDVGPSTDVSFTIVIEPGKVTAALLNERSI